MAEQPIDIVVSYEVPKGEDRIGIKFEEGKMLDKERINEIMEEAGAQNIEVSEAEK